MKVRLQAVDDSGCSYYRMFQPARAANMHEGVEATVVRELEVQRRTLPDGRQQIIPQQLDCDVIVLQRPADIEALYLTPVFQAQGIAVVADLDDDLTCLHPNHPAQPVYNHRNSPNMNARIVQKVCRLADLVTVSTPVLADRFAPHGRSMVLRNCVPQSMVDMPEVDGDGRTVGWSGWTVTHPGDLPVTHGGVADAVERAGARFKVIGSSDGVRQQLGLRDEPEATGFIKEDIPEWQRRVGELDIGIVPLANTAFNQSKSYLKGLEFAARGVPFVASPLPEYERLSNFGVGVIATDRGRTWRARVGALLADESFRVELAARGREVVAEYHTYDVCGGDWADAWELAVENRRRASVRRAA